MPDGESSSPLSDDEQQRLAAEIKADLAALVSRMESRIEQVEAERDRLREALTAVKGPWDSDPWFTTYRNAGGGYEGLQAIAREATMPDGGRSPMDEENRRLIEASDARLHSGSNSEHRCETPLPHAPGVVRSCGVLHGTDVPGLGGEGSIPKANARLAVESLIAERDRLRAAIEDYLLWEPGRAGHAAAHSKLKEALDA